MYSIINGELLTAEEAKISITDLALQRGYGAFDFFKVINFQPRFLQFHLQRFYQSAAELRLLVGMDDAELEKLIFQLIEANNLADSGIKITITGGYSGDGYTLSTPNLILSQSLLSTNTQTGINLVTYNYQRQLPHIKTIDYLHAIYLQPFIKENNAQDVLYHHNGEITECPRANFFIVNENYEVITPAKNILAGITRKRILALKDVEVKEGIITLTDLKNAKEAFITSTTKDVLPVLKIDNNVVGDGKPGKLTAAISQIIR